MSVGRIRPAVSALAAYRPGKGAEQAEAEHGITDAIKLASNENPYEPARAVTAAIAAAASSVNRYGDHRASELRAKIADWVRVEADQIAIGCGSAGILQQLCLAFVDPGDEVVYPWLSFEAYPINVNMMGGLPVTVPLVDHQFDLGAVVEAVTNQTKLIFLATPNNPTGTSISTGQIATLLSQIPDDVIVLIDEAYREFNDPSFGDPIVDLLPTHRNIIVTRTFSKAYGLAGLRIGYGVTSPDLVSEIDKVLLAFSVNSVAQAAASAAIDAAAEIQPKIDDLLSERKRVVTALTDAGWELPASHANFVYMPLADETDSVCLALEQRGIVTRPFSGAGLRVTIGTAEQNDRFIAALTEVASP